ncbi:hypothetical protein GCM10010974_16330 [Brevibacterium sediminis]|uniref:N-acetyltransferase domain-containing protein n=1 Tax=Brevibacterium sediminis TaxID=1857024 RepID=A0ABQ1M6Q5_9MICO|nr:GNAT family N-acetyltransferase [Brevibacterium sediminis]GGC34599.1 hypothetical protein GCM10010974_16330 [Brevibacterium sediminis]
MVLIRTAHPDEFRLVGRVTYEGFGHGSSERGEPTPERLALLMDAEARAAGGDLLVAVDDSDMIIGTASLLRADSALSRQASEGEAELRLLAVLPSARQSGVGLDLMREAITRARDWGAHALVLDTGPHNFRSQRLYHSLGFDRVPEREALPSSGGGPLAVFRYRLDDPEGVAVRLSNDAARRSALHFRSRITSDPTMTQRSERMSEQNSGSSTESDLFDVWRVETRDARRLLAVVLTHRIRPSESEATESRAEQRSPLRSVSVLADVADPIAVAAESDYPDAHAAIGRLLDVLSHGGLAVPARERAGAVPG